MAQEDFNILCCHCRCLVAQADFNILRYVIVAQEDFNILRYVIVAQADFNILCYVIVGALWHRQILTFYVMPLSVPFCGTGRFLHFTLCHCRCLFVAQAVFNIYR